MVPTTTETKQTELYKQTVAQPQLEQDSSAGTAEDCSDGAGCFDIECEALHPQSTYQQYKRKLAILEHLGVEWDYTRDRFYIRGRDREDSELLLISELGFDISRLRSRHTQCTFVGTPDEGHAVAEGAAYRLGVTALERYNVFNAIDKAYDPCTSRASLDYSARHGWTATFRWSCVETPGLQPVGKPVTSPSFQDKWLIWEEEVMLGRNGKIGHGWNLLSFEMPSSSDIVSDFDWGFSLMEMVEELDDYYGEDCLAESVQSMYDDRTERRQLRREKSYP